jgi:hypothetical protein
MIARRGDDSVVTSTSSREINAARNGRDTIAANIKIRHCAIVEKGGRPALSIKRIERVGAKNK